MTIANKENRQLMQRLADGEDAKNIFDYIGEENSHYNVRIVGINGKYNLLSNDGKLLSNIWFDDISTLSDDGSYSCVRLNNKENFINSEGKILSDEWFDCVDAFRNGYACVCLNCKRNLIDADGKILIDKWPDAIQQSNEDGYFDIKSDGQWKRVNI